MTIDATTDFPCCQVLSFSLMADILITLDAVKPPLLSKRRDKKSLVRNCFDQQNPSLVAPLSFVFPPFFFCLATLELTLLKFLHQHFSIGIFGCAESNHAAPPHARFHYQFKPAGPCRAMPESLDGPSLESGQSAPDPHPGRRLPIHVPQMGVAIMHHSLTIQRHV